MKRTLVVGDVHGCLNELTALLDAADFQRDSDRLIFVGDLINRGPNSIGVLDFVRSRGAEAVLGNHELGLLETLDTGSPDTTFDGLITEFGTDLDDWANWIRTLPSYIDDDEFTVVHAGVPPDGVLANCDPGILANIRTWDGHGHDLDCKQSVSRTQRVISSTNSASFFENSMKVGVNAADNPPWYDLYSDPKMIIFGHWAVQGLTVRWNAIGLDTGCVYGRRLTAISLPDRRIYQVPAERAYVKVPVV